MPALLDNLVQLSGGAVAYVVVLGLVAGDGMLPVIPGEVAMITGGALAAQGRLSVVWLMAAGLAGAGLGDNGAFLAGRTTGGWIERHLFSGDRSARRLAWARGHLRRRTFTIIAAGRFVPGGRTAATFASGSLGVPWRRFCVADVVGCGAWVAYATALGWLGGESFQHTTWKALLLSAGVALLVVAGLEGARRIARRRASGRHARSLSVY